MGFNYTGAATTEPHQHSDLASDGGQLSLSATRITNLSPMALVVALG